jgi:hypothetical protein
VYVLGRVHVGDGVVASSGSGTYHDGGTKDETEVASLVLRWADGHLW